MPLMKSLRNIYFVQAGILYGENAYFPYAAGCVAAYAWNNPLIRENYHLGHFTFLRTPVAQAVESFQSPFLVAFSNYVWNFEYHKALAKAIKKRWPDCLILFGGHQVLNDSSRQLDEYPFVDFLVHRAGEIPFETLLLVLLQGTDIHKVPSLSYRDINGKALRSKEVPSCKSCSFPSPYLAGIFDALFQEYPSLLFSMTLETNRGCPYGCAYCDWGTVQHELFSIPMERIEAEIDWAVQHKIEFLFCADGNFGIMERDEAIVDYLIEIKRRTGYPKKFNTSYAKNSNETVLRINQKLSMHGLNSGATLAFQSLSPIVLKNIGRKNLDFKQFQDLASLYNQVGVPVYSDMIIGLPGETLESFTRGIGRLLAAGMHGSLEVYPCELLPNAEMSNPAYQEKHGIQTIRIRQFHRYGSPKNQDEIPEYSEIVRQTNTMPAEDWVSAYLFSTVVQGFHNLGLLRCFAAYLHCAQQLPYECFYSSLIDYAKSNPSTLVGELLSLFEKRYRSLSEGNGESLMYYDPRFGEVLWPLGGALFLCAAYESGRLFEELPAFLQRYGMDTEMVAQLIRYQHTMVHLPAAPPLLQVFDYDFPAHFAGVFAGRRPALQKRRTAVTFPAQEQISSWVDFAREYVWYGRRKGLLVRGGYKVTYGC